MTYSDSELFKQSDRSNRKPVERAEVAEVLTYRPGNLNAPAADFPKIDAEKLNDFNGRKFEKIGPPSPPLNLLGGYRWTDAATPKRQAKIRAAIDTELGVGVPVVSPNGVTVYRIPPRHRVRK